MRRLLAILICLSLIIPGAGCASAGGTRMATPTTMAPSVVDTAAMADYVGRLQAGSKVRVELTSGAALRGTLMKTAPDAIVVQKNTRIPEAPIQIPLAQIARVTVDNGGTSPAKAVGIGIASGVGVFFGILAILAATLND